MKHFNIMYIPQFSMNDGKYHFVDKDGNFVVLTTIIKLINKWLVEKVNSRETYEVGKGTLLGMPSIKLIVVMPPTMSIRHSVFYDEIESLQVLPVEFLQIFTRDMDFFRISPIENRYNFDVRGYKSFLINEQIDVVFNNIPELTRNLRATMGNEQKPIVNLHHFCDYFHENKLVTNWKNGELFSYFWRQLDGYLSGDYNIFNCLESKQGWYEALQYSLSPHLFSQLNSKTDLQMVWTDLTQYVSTSPHKFEVPTAIFGSRITESLYTNWTKVMELFADDNIKGRVILTNPSGEKGLKVVDKYIKEHWNTGLDYWGLSTVLIGNRTVPSFISPNGKIQIIKGNLSREDYIGIASQSQFAINLYENERYGGISIRECVGYGGALPIVPDIYSFSHWLKDTNPQAKFKDIDELTVEKYNLITELYETVGHQKILQNFQRYEHYETYYPEFKEMLEVLLNGKS